LVVTPFGKSNRSVVRQAASASRPGNCRRNRWRSHVTARARAGIRGEDHVRRTVDRRRDRVPHHDALLANTRVAGPSFAVHVTKVVPSGKDAGALLVTVTVPQFHWRLACETHMETTHEFAGALMARSAGQMSVGGWASRTMTRCEQVVCCRSCPRPSTSRSSCERVAAGRVVRRCRDAAIISRGRGCPDSHWSQSTARRSHSPSVRGHAMVGAECQRS